MAIDTLYAEGQRRFVESFSPYARQFLERRERPPVASLEQLHLISSSPAPPLGAFVARVLGILQILGKLLPERDLAELPFADLAELVDRLAADEGTSIAMRHLMRAARSEYQAMGKVISQL